MPGEIVHDSSWEVFRQNGQGLVLDDFWRFFPNETICDSAILWSFMLYKKQAFYKMFSFCYVFNDSFATTLAVWYFQISSSLILSQNNLHFFQDIAF